jgi:hypothetical protein
MGLEHVVAIVRLVNHLWIEGDFMAYIKYCDRFKIKLIRKVIDKNITFSKATDDILKLQVV